MSRTRYKIFDDTKPYFLTATVVAWLPVFSKPSCVEIVLDSFQFLRKNDRLTLFGYVIMENHLHFIGAAKDLSKEVRDFKSFTAKKILQELGNLKAYTLLQELEFFKARHKTQSQYQFWQEGSYPKEMNGNEMMLQKLEYMHNNPIRRGYVEEAVHWRYSSARNYMGMAGLLDVVTDWS